MLFRLIDRMALFTLSHLLLYVRGETAENSTSIPILNGVISLSAAFLRGKKKQKVSDNYIGDCND